MNQNPSINWGLYMPIKNWRLRCRGVYGQSNRSKWTAPFGPQASNNIFAGSFGFAMPTGLWAVCWDDLDANHPTRFAIAPDPIAGNGVKIRERRDLSNPGTRDEHTRPPIQRGIVRVFEVSGTPNPQWVINLTASASSGRLKYDELWICCPADVDGSQAPVTIDRSDPWALSRQFIETCDPARLGSIRCVDSTIGGDPGTFPYPEYMRSLSDETWGEYNQFMPSVGVVSVGPVDPSLTYQ
jgi:hypothetical protein